MSTRLLRIDRPDGEHGWATITAPTAEEADRQAAILEKNDGWRRPTTRERAVHYVLQKRFSWIEVTAIWVLVYIVENLF